MSANSQKRTLAAYGVGFFSVQAFELNRGQSVNHSRGGFDDDLLAGVIDDYRGLEVLDFRRPPVLFGDELPWEEYNGTTLANSSGRRR